MNDDVRVLGQIIYDLQETLAHDVLDEEEREERMESLEWFENELDELDYEHYGI